MAKSQMHKNEKKTESQSIMAIFLYHKINSIVQKNRIYEFFQTHALRIISESP
jgi:hypothetical protein